MLYGAIEAGGTKFNCAIGTRPNDLNAVTRIPTTTPDQTLGAVIAYFKAQPRVDAIGMGAFGPLDLHTGYITSTPKPGWRNIDLVGTLQRALNVPIQFDTDVNVAALGERTWGAAQGLDNFIYVTIGTGIGGGGLMNGKLMHGLMHPEMGHLLLPHDWQTDPFPGTCPFHGDCLEGLANGPAIEKRWGQRAETLPPAHPAWQLEAHYIALAAANWASILSPQRIILGGGVMEQTQLLPMVQAQTRALLNGYLDQPAITQHIDEYIVLPQLGARAGVLGALALAQLD